jgi:hypothetical protein
LHSGDGPEDGAGKPPPLGETSLDHDDLPYVVEVWDVAGEFVEHVVAVSAHPAIGYAAFYAAAREFYGRDITLRYKGRVLSRFAGTSH